MSFTLAYITARRDCRYDWLFSSLNNCGGRELVTQIILVDFYAQACDDWTLADVHARAASVWSDSKRLEGSFDLNWTHPKPNVWAGKHRLTPRNWWHKAASINTSLCMAKNDFIIFVDDRCILKPTFLDAAREAKQHQYMVCGSYEKVHDLVYEDGKVVSYTEPKDDKGRPTGKDGRYAHANGNKMICPGRWAFGCAYGLPTEWMLNVNGCDELWDSISMEDTMFGQMIENAGYPVQFDPRMAIIEDRSPSAPSHDMKRDSKEKHSGDTTDKTHTLMRRLEKSKRSEHQWDLRKIRESVLNGGSFPVPSQPTHDWFDQQALAEMV